MTKYHHLHTLQDFESLGTSICGICYDIAEQYWAAWGLSESVVFHVVVWVSFCVFLCLCCCCCCCLLFVCWFWLKTPSFLLSPILQHVGIAYQRQNVLMTVWASSAHGMSTKKKLEWEWDVRFISISWLKGERPGTRTLADQKSQIDERSTGSKKTLKWRV